jgi:hypothetical protein
MPYLTPDTPPDDTICYTLRIPNDKTWIGIVKGAVSELIKDYNFEAFGDYSPEDTALRFLDMYDEFVFSECQMACCYDVVNHRVTDDGQLQISVNDGDWQQDPSDPRLNGVSMPPPTLDETHTKCDAASNGLQHFQDLVATHSNDLAIATTVFELLGLIALEVAALIFAPESAPILFPILVGTVIALFAFGKTAFDAYWVSDRYDEVLCAMYCNIGDDGQFTDAQFTAFLAQYSSTLPASVAKDMLYRDMIATGKKGLNNMCSYGASASADCSACCVCEIMSHWSKGLWASGALSDNDGSGVLVETGDCYFLIDAHDRGDGTMSAYLVCTDSDTDNCIDWTATKVSGTENDFTYVFIGCGTDRTYTNFGAGGMGSPNKNAVAVLGQHAGQDFRVRFDIARHT